jgi:N-methylhydantoinase A/oxoprolinase/acetone carboxylase beta subunit/N-methylhydantoinase B/oxoprolinase/acetone carboxylase alpha subunit
MSTRIAIDTGGTFTDLVGVTADGEVVTAKVPSQPADPGAALLQAVSEAGVDHRLVDDLAIGTTVATNAVLERTGARVVFVTTDGFGDVPFIGRTNKERLYDLSWNKPKPLVRRTDVIEVAERVDAHGSVVTPLSVEDIDETVRLVAAAVEEEGGAVAVAISTLFSYVNGGHERRLLDGLAKAMPELPVSTSHDVSPTWREFERASTTIADAYVKPTVETYFDGLARRLHELAPELAVSVMKSNGGRLSVDSAQRRPVELMLSGPAGGVIAARRVAEDVGTRDVVTLDMGGTSTDIGVIVEGRPAFREEFEIEWGVPASISSVDVRTIGAGGGSILWFDAAGMLRVGPQSAGSSPGPACYGRGGTLPTITDANLVLGRVSPTSFAGGLLLDADLARRALDGLVPDSPFADAVELASAAIALASENMANAVRLVGVEKGLDLREFALMPYGGAGPLHASSIARSLEVKSVIVPPLPGQLSALGVLMADSRVDRTTTLHARADAVNVDELRRRVAALEAAVVAELRGPPGELQLEYAVAMRYSGQSYERQVELPEVLSTRRHVEQAVDMFHQTHLDFYGFSSQGHPVEIVNLKVTGTVSGRRPHLPALSRHEGAAPVVAHRRVFFTTTGFVECPVYARSALAAGASLSGPAIIEEAASTTVLEPGDSLIVDSSGALRITASDRSEAGSSRTAAGTNEVARRSQDLVVLHNALANAADEMATVMLRTAYSTIFTEGVDFSTVIVDRQGNLIAEKNYTPSMIGAIPHTVQWALEELGEDYFAPGDVVVHNDPYRGNCHLPEHILMKPIFVGDELFGFAAVMGHISEIGGMAVGSFAAQATDIYQEGLRLPPVKLIDRGEYVSDVWRIILTNHRTPRFTWGDFHAMIGALNIGERRVQHLVEKHGHAYVRDGGAELQDYSERLMRAAIDRLPDGDYEAWMHLEDDGVDVDPVLFRVVAKVRGDEFIADWTGSDPQTRGPINCTYVVTAAAVYNAVFCIVDPESAIPRNHGCYRPIKFIAPAGTVVNVSHPGSCVSGNTETQPKLIDLLLAALLPAAPERVAAAAGGTPANFLFGGNDPATDEFFSVYHLDGAGSGATARADGNPGEITRHSNCRNMPAEVLEARYPWRQLEYRLVPDSGGAGKRRGGLGLQATFEALQPMTISALFDRLKFPPWGLEGGLEGGKTQLLLKRSGASEFAQFTAVAGTSSPTKFSNVAVAPGDQVRYRTPGGGGFAPPTLRDQAAVVRDVEEGFVSKRAAAELYGVVLRSVPGGVTVDQRATDSLRGVGPGAGVSSR